MKVFIFGAGASAGTFPAYPDKIPVGPEFGEVLAGVYPKWATQYPSMAKAVRHVVGDRKAWSLEAVWTAIDYYSKLSKALGRRDFGADASRQLRQVLLRVYGERCSKAARRLPPDNSYTLGDILRNQVQGKAFLVSFNYDTVVEVLSNKMGLELIQASRKSPRSAVTLAKPHGSVSWTKDSRTHKVRFCDEGCRPLLSSLRPAEVTKKREPLVLGAVPIKSELLREVQGKKWKQVYNTISEQWKQTVAAVAGANEVVVVGYSFPREDQYGRFLLREAIQQRRKDAGPISLQYYELAERMAEVGKAILETFGEKNIQIQWCGAVEAPRSSG